LLLCLLLLPQACIQAGHGFIQHGGLLLCLLWHLLLCLLLLWEDCGELALAASHLEQFTAAIRQACRPIAALRRVFGICPLLRLLGGPAIGQRPSSCCCRCWCCCCRW
jgi:hypothetical protein